MGFSSYTHTTFACSSLKQDPKGIDGEGMELMSEGVGVSHVHVSNVTSPRVSASPAFAKSLKEAAAERHFNTACTFKTQTFTSFKMLL